MARGLTKSDIFMACDTIASKGKMPSIAMVRKHLGDTGSESTILKYLREWKEGLLMKNQHGCVLCECSNKENQMLKQQLAAYKRFTTEVRESAKRLLDDVKTQSEPLKEQTHYNIPTMSIQ